MKNRIEKILREKSIVSSKFADEIGIQRSTMSHILSGRNNPSLDIIQRILKKYPNISSDWLVLGVGNMYKKSSQSSFFDDIKQSEKEINKNKNDYVVEQIDKVEQAHLKKQNETNDKNFIKEKKIKKILIFYNDGTFEEVIV